MPTIRNLSHSLMILEHVQDEPIVLKPNETADIPQEALSLPLIQHYLEVKRLDLVHQQEKGMEVILSRK